MVFSNQIILMLFYHYRLVFKKRPFLGERPLHTACVAEMELLYYQVLHAVRHDRLPIETDEAVSYCYFAFFVCYCKQTFSLRKFKSLVI